MINTWPIVPSPKTQYQINQSDMGERMGGIKSQDEPKHGIQ